METGNTEDFDFDFIKGTITSSAEEIRGSLVTCVDDMKKNINDAELLEGTEDLAAQLNGQVAAVCAIQEQFSEFLNRTDYVQEFAQSKQQEYEQLKYQLDNNQKDSESSISKIGYLEEEIRLVKSEQGTNEQNIRRMEQEIDELRHESADKDSKIQEHKETQQSLEQQIEEQKKAEEKQESANAKTHLKLTDELNTNTDELAEMKIINEQLKQQNAEQQKRITNQEQLHTDLQKKFEEWEKVFNAELSKAREKANTYKVQMDGDKQGLLNTIEQQESEIKELKVQLTSKDLELQDGNLQYDMLAAADQMEDCTVDEGEEGEESKFEGLDGEFGRERSSSQIEADQSISGTPMMEQESFPEQNELSELESGMLGNGREQEYAEINDGAHNDIFEQDNYDECDRLAIVNRQMFREMDNQSLNSASTISQKWEQDARKDPEEEYFRLSCLALKIIYNEQDTDFVFTVSPGKLYTKCKKQKIPFHLWYTWIEKELQKVNDLQKRAVEAQQAPKSLMQRISNAITFTRGPPSAR